MKLKKIMSILIIIVFIFQINTVSAHCCPGSCCVIENNYLTDNVLKISDCKATMVILQQINELKVISRHDEIKNKMLMIHYDPESNKFLLQLPDQ